MDKNLAVDAVERIFWTFVQAFIATLLASSFVDEIDTWKDSLIVAALAGGVAALKVILAISIDRTSGGQLAPGNTVEVKTEP
jgi:hypothetical protein